MTLSPRIQEITSRRLNDLVLPTGGWSSEARSAALNRVQSLGLPSNRDEYWKFTPPETLTTAQVPPASLFVDVDESPVFGNIDRLKLVFVDGVFDAAASDQLALENVTIERLGESKDRDDHWGREVYGVLEQSGQVPVARPLAALNTAFATDGILIHVRGTPSKPINLVYVHSNETSDAILHHVIKVNPGAECTILESGPAAARFNKCMEIDIADGGALHHVRAQGRDHERRAATHMFARVAANALFKSFTLTVNGRLTRNEIFVELLGRNSMAHVAGACVGDGDFHHDDTVFVTHAAEDCKSRQVFKKVLRNGATGVFQGKILVKPDAQKTDGYQISQSLLLDGDSQFLAKPELEIYADDVACSHGSTSGAIDEGELFYLRARGIEQAEATDLLTLAFLNEAVSEIDNEELADDIQSRLAAWLMRHRPS